MTGFLHEKQFSRKSFVKGGGALIISFSALGAAGAASAATGNTPFTARTPNDFLPDLQQVDSWIAITTDNRVIVTHGEPEASRALADRFSARFGWQCVIPVMDETVTL